MKEIQSTLRVPKERLSGTNPRVRFGARNARRSGTSQEVKKSKSKSILGHSLHVKLKTLSRRC